MSSWPSKRKKSGRTHISKEASSICGASGKAKNKRGTGKSIASGIIRSKKKAELQRTLDELKRDDEVYF